MLPDGMKDRQNLRCSYLCACGFALRRPVPATRAIILNASPAPAPASQDPRMPGPRRLPPRPHLTIRRPGSLSITAPCGQTGCFTVTVRADGRLRRPHPRARWGSRPKTARPAPARRHPSRHPKHSAKTGTKLGAAGGWLNPFSIEKDGLRNNLI